MVRNQLIGSFPVRSDKGASEDTHRVGILPNAFRACLSTTLNLLTKILAVPGIRKHFQELQNLYFTCCTKKGLQDYICADFSLIYMADGPFAQVLLNHVFAGWDARPRTTHCDFLQETD